MLTFSNGDTMPLFGLGTWRSTRDETYNSVYEAITAAIWTVEGSGYTQEYLWKE